MRILISFISFCLINTPLLSADVDDSIDLESHIRVWYTEYKRSAPPSIPTLRRSATFVGHLHNQLLQQETEEGVELFSRAILAVIGRGAGVGGLRVPRNDTDKSYLLTPAEKAIVQPALLDAEKLRRKEFDIAQDYFGTPDQYFAKARSDQIEDALRQHAKKVHNIASQVHSLAVAINEPQAIQDDFIHENLIEALQHLKLSSSVMIPEIYRVRAANHSLNYFDVFNMAFHDPSAMREILTKWDQPRHDIPLAYYTLQGLPNSIPEDLIIPVIEKISSLSQEKLAKKLLIETKQTEEHILETLRTKSISGIRSTIILGLFLNKYLLETDRALLLQDDLLHLFKIMGREIDSDVKRSEICLRALKRFMNIYSTTPLTNVINALISGITYSPADQMLDFYLEGIRMVYREALSRYYSANKGEILKITAPIFQLAFSPGIYPTLSSQCDQLKNAVLTDLLRDDYLDVTAIGTFTKKSWVNWDNKSALIESFKTGIARMQIADLFALLQDSPIDINCIKPTQDRINELLVDSLQRDSLGLLDIYKLSVASWVTPTNRTTLNEKLNLTIVSLPQSNLLQLMQDRTVPSDFKLLLINRLVELGAWDELTNTLASNNKNGIVFRNVLQRLQENGQLNASRITFALQVIDASPDLEDLLKVAKEVDFAPDALFSFEQAMHGKRGINHQAAQAWVDEYLASKTGKW